VRRPRLPLGLRPRMIGALVLTSVVTLAVAAAGVLAPLEQRLRRGERDSLIDDAAAARPVLAEALESGRPADLRTAVARLARRSDARVGVVDAAGRLVAGTPIDAGELPGDAQASRAVAHRARPVVLRGNDRGVAVALAVPAAQGRRLTVVLRRSATDARVGARIVRHAFLLAAAVSLLVAIVVGRAVTGRLLRRLQRLRRTAGAMTEIEAPVELVHDAARDEVGDLSRALTAMQVRLHRQEAARKAFVATASHELRTPLAMLGLTLELAVADLEGEAPDLGDARVLLARALEQSRRLGRLSGDLLDLSRIDADVPLRAEPVELAEVCRATLAEFAVRAGTRVRLELAPGGEAEAVAGDPGAVARILRILVDNALRATPDGGAVSVAIAREGDRVRLQVSDSGDGVAPGDGERIFERFVRGAEAAGGPGGFGLGLAIGRELARRMGGDLRLDRDGAAPGASFSLYLAAARAPHGALVPAAALVPPGTPTSG
jgi:signal transduction histidine kinase